MGTVWMRARSDLRARWRGALVLAVLLGITGGIAMTAAAGARRTATSYERLLRSTNAYDVEVQITGDSGPDPEGAILDRVAALPQVADSGRIAFIPSTRASTARPPKPFSWDVTSVALVDRNIGRTLEIARLLSGRRADPDQPHEATVSTDFLRAHKVSVGSEFPLQLVSFQELLRLFEGRPVPPTGPVATIRIVGEENVPHVVSIREQTGILFLTPAFYEQYHERIAHLGSLLVRLRNGERDVPRFVEATRAIGDETVLSVETQTSLVARVDRALGVQSTALWGLAAAVAVGGILVLGQALARWLMFGADDVPTLRALGFGRGHLAATFAVPAAVIGLAGAAIASAVCLSSSPLVPVGLARELDPDLGFFADARVLAIGAAAVLAFIGIRGWLQGAGAARRSPGVEDRRRRKPSAVADGLSRTGVSPAVVTGVRFALETGGGRTAVPIRSVLAGTVLSIVAISAAFVFARNLDRMLGAPEMYGWNWDLVAFGGEDPEIAREVERILSDSKHVAAFSRASIKGTGFRGDDLETLSVVPIEGRVLPSMIEGRFPEVDDEVALATRTMRSAGLRIGDRVPFTGAPAACPAGSDCTISFRIVGRLVFWAEGSDPDRGAAFTEAGQAKIRTSEGFADYLVRIPSGENPRTARRAIEEEIHGDAALPELPVNIENVARARTMPAVLASILAALGVATIAHALITAARRRRRDVAVLKTLGFVRRQVRAAVAWQSTTTVLIALVIGLPLGIVLGRWAWVALADRLGVLAAPISPAGWLAIGSAAVILLANIIALVPARMAARTRPAIVLRTE